MTFMIIDRVGVYEYVIQIYSDEYPNMFSEYPGHQPLKRRGSVTVALLHNMRYERSQCSCKCCLPHIANLNSYLFIGVRHIDFCSIFGSGYVHADLILIWEWGHVLRSE